LLPSLPTAKTLNFRSVCLEAHSGQATASLLDMDFTSFSNE
jgi:hypothetical protein